MIFTLLANAKLYLNRLMLLSNILFDKKTLVLWPINEGGHILPCHWRTIAHVFFFWQNGHVSNSCSFICCYYYCLAECFVLTIMSPSDDISGYKGCKKILLAKSKRRNHPTKQFHNLFFNLKNLKHKISQYSKTSENIDQCETHCSGGRFDPWIGTTKKMIYF